MQPKAVSLSRTDAISPQIKWLMMGMLALAFVLMQAVVALAKPESLAPLAEKISPSVVNITTSTTVEGRTGPVASCPKARRSRIFSRNSVTATMVAKPPRHANRRRLGRGLSSLKTGSS